MNWPDTGPTLKCPVCSGPIGFWVIQPVFACHHCKARLSSNHRRVQSACIYTSLAAWLVASVLLAVLANRAIGEAALLVAQFLVPVCVAGGWLALKYRVHLVRAVGATSGA